MWKEVLGEQCVAEYEVNEELARQGTVVIVNSFDEAVFDAIRKKVGRKQFIAFTQNEVITGADVFPIEWLSIRTTGKLIAGEDVLGTVTIDGKHLRMQLEGELRGKLLDLRQHIIMEKSKRHLASFLRNGAIAIVPLLRAALAIKKHDHSGSVAELIAKVDEQWGLKSDVVARLSHTRAKDARVVAQELRVWLKEFGQKVNDIQLE